MATSLSTSVEREVSELEHLSPHVTCEWLYNRRVVVITTADSSRATVDLWANRAKEIMTSWPVDQPFFMAQDVSSPNTVSTPYARERARELMKLRVDLPSYHAMIVAPTYMMRLAQMFLWAYRRKNFEMRLFTKREEALNWLSSKL